MYTALESYLPKLKIMARLKTRIAKLEQVSSTGELTSSAAKLLIALLGRRDALFFPTRTNKGKVAIVQRQRAYLDGTEGIAAKADGAGAWKDAHFQRAELIQHGFATANRSGGQVTSLFLTTKGDAYAKSMVWDCPEAKVLNEVSRVLWQLLRDFEKKPWCNRKWVSEGELFDLPCVGDPVDWSDRTELMLPLLVAGLVVSNNDAYGRIYYYATDVEFPAIESVELPKIADQAWTDAYLRAFKFETRALETAEPNDTNEIVIPIPASGW